MRKLGLSETNDYKNAENFRHLMSASRLLPPTVAKINSTCNMRETVTPSQRLSNTQSYVVGSKSFRPDQLFKVTEIKLCYFST